MYPLDFLALPLGALSRPLSIHPISLSVSPYLSFASREEVGVSLPLCTGFPDMKSAIDMDHDGSLLKLEARGASGMGTNRFHKIELQIFRTIFNCLASLREFPVMFEYLHIAAVKCRILLKLL